MPKAGEAGPRRTIKRGRVSLAADIDTALHELGLNYSDFARVIGTAPSNVEKWVCTGIEPRSKFFVRVMEELGLDPADYFDLEMKQLGKAVAAARYRKGWTLEELAAKSGVSFSTLQKIETYDRRPAKETVLAICAALDLDAEAMLLLRERLPVRN